MTDRGVGDKARVIHAGHDESAEPVTVIRAKADKPKKAHVKKSKASKKSPGINPHLLNEAYKEAIDLAKHLQTQYDTLSKELKAVKEESHRNKQTLKKLKEIFVTQEIPPIEFPRLDVVKVKRSIFPWRDR